MRKTFIEEGRGSLTIDNIPVCLIKYKATHFLSESSRGVDYTFVIEEDYGMKGDLSGFVLEQEDGRRMPVEVTWSDRQRYTAKSNGDWL